MIGIAEIEFGSLIIFKRKHNEAMTFYKTFFAHLLGVGKPVQWFRLAPNGLIRSHMKITKEYML